MAMSTTTLRLLFYCFLACVPLSSGEAPPAADGLSSRRPDGRHGAAHRGYVSQRPHPCDQSSCYPATGNLLIGRDDRLEASSTCGLFRQERYCIVSHLENRKKCFWCDSRPHNDNNPGLSHKVQNLITVYAPRTRQRSWWQSENGVENVTIQLDLEAEFHFTHLIMTFKTFRPAAMLIERSYDFGATWHVYRYFAYDCAASFPGVKVGPPSKITEVVCESRYSNVAPSTEGEIIFRVLPPNLPIDDPYSPEVQSLLKMTNLRVNFTKLHTLGDDLLDKRADIQEKYYYSLYEMVVRGSCSCYGHAFRCLPLPGVDPRPDMVHGRCECTHNTKGLNCEQCQDFYWDLPWRPAIGRQTNACKRCECNNHATSCHFDHAVYEATGRISGGVCDACQHNTMGRNCEQCKPFYYQDPTRDMSDPEVCQPCDCDPRGSLEDAICDSRDDLENGLVAGRCHCKTNVDGRRCDRCKNGFWNFDVNDPDGCRACTCNLEGTINNQGCNPYSGECTCKRYVTGSTCNECAPEHWGLSGEERDGCKPCDCDPGGSLDNQCDVFTGQCRCRLHVSGRRCNQPDEGYFAGLMDYMVYEAEFARGSPNTQVVTREPYRDGRRTTWTGTGFTRVFEDSYLEFDIDNVATSLEYDLVVRYEPTVPGVWQDVRIDVERDGTPIDLDGPCANIRPGDDEFRTSLSSDGRYVVISPPICLEKGKHYKVRIDFKRFDPTVVTPSASALIDSIALIPRVEDVPFYQPGVPENARRRLEFDHFRCAQMFYGATSQVDIPEECKNHLFSIGYYVNNGANPCDCDQTGSQSSICDPLGGQCLCKTNVVGKRCGSCAPGTYGFGPEGCSPCECNSVGSLDNFCDEQSGQCRCRPNTYGRACNRCQPGYWNFPNCQRCECNGHANECDPETGYCLDCRDYTGGEACERCVEGYYGDPRLGIDIPCRACPCPGLAESDHNHAAGCSLDPVTRDVVCQCHEGYAAPRCDICSDNYFGSPEIPGGAPCLPCNCSGNIDLSRPGNCDSRSGECLLCLFDTQGFFCEECRDGYYGDAVSKLCGPCDCELLGTSATVDKGLCDRKGGQCPCLPHVVGRRCDRCEDGYWKIGIGTGCEPCDCDPTGAHNTQCNVYDGQCACKDGFAGRRCDQCEDNFWGNPKEDRCFACDCDLIGSSTLQCHRNNGTCVCRTGVGGDRCDRCARGYLGDGPPRCVACGECFESWDRIVNELAEETRAVISAASNIQETGVTGGYTSNFEEMEKKLMEVKAVLANATISSSDLEDLDRVLERLRQDLVKAADELDRVDDSLTNSTQRVLAANADLRDLRDRIGRAEVQAKDLKENATRLQEANVEGALNLTRDARQRGHEAKNKARRAELSKAADSERQRKATEVLLERFQGEFNRTLEQSHGTLEKMQQELDGLDSKFPELNELVCDKRGDPCDDLCGGAGCGFCGGTSCKQGAVTMAQGALEFATVVQNSLKSKSAEAEDLSRGLTQAKMDADKTLILAREAHDLAQQAQNRSAGVRTDVEDLISRVRDFLDTPGAGPADIRNLAEEVLALDVSLRPEQITELASRIDETVLSLTDIEFILRETAADLDTARNLKTRADDAKEDAEVVLQKAQKVIESLDAARNAQDQAARAIDEASEDIADAQRDLTQINSDTASAHDRAMEAERDLADARAKVNALQGQILQMQLDVNDAEREGNAAAQQGADADRQYGELEAAYGRATSHLSSSEGTSGRPDDARQRAKELKDRAAALAANATQKQRDLQEMERELAEGDVRMQDLATEIGYLTQRMDEYLVVIDERARKYRECTN